MAETVGGGHPSFSRARAAPTAAQSEMSVVTSRANRRRKTRTTYGLAPSLRLLRAA